MSVHDDDDDEIKNYKFQDARADDDEGDVATAPDDRDTIRCPRCRKFIFDDAEQCPYCKTWISKDLNQRKPLWFIIAAVICLIIVVLWALRG